MISHEHKFTQILDPTPATALGQILGASILEFTPTAPRRLRVLGHYSIVVVIDGEGTYRDAGGRLLPIIPGTAFLCFPDIPFLAAPPIGRTWRDINMGFAGPIFDQLRARKLIDPAFPIRRSANARQWWDNILAIAKSPHDTDSDRTRRVLQVADLLLDICSESAISDSPEHTDWLSTACHLLGRDFSHTIGVGYVAERLGMPVVTFRMKFAREIGVAPMQYRARLRLDAAKHLLASSTLTAKEISLAVGYGSEAHFSRQFRKMIGMTPLTYRAQHFRAGAH